MNKRHRKYSNKSIVKTFTWVIRQSQTGIFSTILKVWNISSLSEAKQRSKIRSLGDFKPLFDYLRIHYSAPFVLQKFLFQKRIFVWCLALPFTSSFPYKFHCHHKKRLKLSRNDQKLKNVRKWIEIVEESSENLTKICVCMRKFRVELCSWAKLNDHCYQSKRLKW